MAGYRSQRQAARSGFSQVRRKAGQFARRPALSGFVEKNRFAAVKVRRDLEIKLKVKYGNEPTKYWRVRD